MSRRVSRQKLRKALRDEQARRSLCAVPGCNANHGLAVYKGESPEAGEMKRSKKHKQPTDTRSQICSDLALFLRRKPQSEPKVTYRVAVRSGHTALWDNVPSGGSIPTVSGIRGRPHYA